MPFTTPAIALREGYLKYNVTAGQYRSPDDAVEQTSLGQVTAMYGLPWGLTVYGGVQGAEHYQAAAPGLAGHWGVWGRCRWTRRTPGGSRRDMIMRPVTLAYPL